MFGLKLVSTSEKKVLKYRFKGINVFKMLSVSSFQRISYQQNMNQLSQIWLNSRSKSEWITKKMKQRFMIRQIIITKVILTQLFLPLQVCHNKHLINQQFLTKIVVLCLKLWGYKKKLTEKETKNLQNSGRVQFQKMLLIQIKKVNYKFKDHQWKK